MTSTLLKQVERLRYIAILLLSVCAFGTANAQLSSDEISEAILLEGSVPVKWTNDEEHPWALSEYDSYKQLTTTESADDSAFTSTISFSFTSQYPTNITFQWRKGTSNSEDILKLSVDGEEKETTTSSSWNDMVVFIATEGSHTIELTSVSTRTNFDSSSYRAGIRNLKVREYKELESSCLQEGSLPLTFENQSNLEQMWITEDGYISSSDGTSTTKVSTTFTITDRPLLFAFEYRTLTKGYPNGNANVFVDGVFYSSTTSSNWNSNAIVLYPGTHTVEFINWVENGSTYNTRETQVRNVRLEQSWYEVTLNNPGELGLRVTQALEGKPLQDMELLKINGAMNSDDWDAIKLLTGIKAVDFTGTGITSVPKSAFSGKSYLSTVILPETVTSIEDYAFYETNFYSIDIPASVESIGNYVWRDSGLKYITFAENSKLNYIGYGAFANTRIMEFDMPDSVETLGDTGSGPSDYRWYEGLFGQCKSLKRLHLSNRLTKIPYGLTASCTALEEVNLPDHLVSIGSNSFYGINIESVTIPKSVTTIGGTAFSYCENLKEVYLNSHCWDMYSTFSGCKALEKIVVPCATPPSISYDPFSGVDKTSVTLVVPDFAFDTYRTNPYWYNFTNTIKGDEASINEYWAIRGTLNLNNTLVMRGNPSVEMMEGGILTLDSDSSQTFDEFTYNTSEGKPSVVLSQSNTVSAGRLVSKFYVSYRDQWYFFSPVTDVKMSEVSYPATDSWVIRYYDGARRASEDVTSGNWINVPIDGTLKAGHGYIIQAREAGWVYLPAASTTENDKFFGANEVTFELEDNACETEANAGWNFVANPYPTYYDIYYIDMQAPITVWTGSTYKAYSLNDGDRGDDTFVLRPMQPFFVQKSAETPDLSTGMPLVGRQVNTTIDRSRAPRPIVKDENRQKLNLELYCNDNDTADDYTRVVLNEQASLGYETVRDASKFMSMDANVAQLYTLGADNHPMAINERPYEDGNVALGVLLPATDRTYRIAALRADRQAWLYDAETCMEFDLTEGDYIFSASKTGIDNKRFSIRLAPASTSSVDGINETVKVAGNVGSISVTAPAGAAVAVFGTDGSIITNTTAENGTLEISVAGGVYVVKVNGESYKTIVK